MSDFTVRKYGTPFEIDVLDENSRPTGRKKTAGEHSWIVINPFGYFVRDPDSRNLARTQNEQAPLLFTTEREAFDYARKANEEAYDQELREIRESRERLTAQVDARVAASAAERAAELRRRKLEESSKEARELLRSIDRAENELLTIEMAVKNLEGSLAAKRTELEAARSKVSVLKSSLEKLQTQMAQAKGEVK
jgi:chromosome segregation ATPase